MTLFSSRVMGEGHRHCKCIQCTLQTFSAV